MRYSRSLVLWAFAFAVACAALFSAAASASVAVGDKAPDFKLTNVIDGDKAVKLSDYTNKPTLLVFWASWCPHCQREVPVLQKVFTDLKGKGMNAVGISADQARDDAKGFVKRYNVTFPNAFAGNDDGAKVIDSYEVQGVPTIFLLDKNRNVVWTHVGEASEDSVRAALAKVGVK
jgi:peroxiredoxin